MSENGGSTLWRSILVAVIVGLLGIPTNLFIWNWQQDRLLVQKSRDYKYELLKETAFVCAKFQKLKENHLMYTIMINKLREENPEFDRNIEVRSKSIAKLNEAMPDVYQASLEANQYVPNIQTQLILVQVFFGSQTREAAKEYFRESNTTSDEYVAMLKLKMNEAASHEVKEYQLQDAAILAGSKMSVALQKLLGAMRAELESTQD